MNARKTTSSKSADGRRPTKNVDISTYHFLIVLIDQVGRLLRMAIKYGCYGYIAWIIGQAVSDLAGKTTVVDLLASFFISTARGNVVALSFVFTGFAGAWGLAERKVRQMKVRELSDRIIVLEKMIDPERTSSGLTGYGLTHPKDNQG